MPDDQHRPRDLLLLDRLLDRRVNRRQRNRRCGDSCLLSTPTQPGFPTSTAGHALPISTQNAPQQQAQSQRGSAPFIPRV